MAVTGGYKTLLPESDWSKLKMNNQNLELRKAKMVFRPYGTKYSLKVLGKVRVKLQCMWSRDNRSPY